MKVRMLFLLIAASLVGSAAGQQGKSDADKLKGTWLVTEMAKGEFADKLLGARFTFADGKGTISFKEKEEAFTFKLDPSKKPRELDLMPESAGKGQTVKAIYALDGDSLKICFAPDPGSNNKRPSEFKDDQKTQILFGLKRQKP